MVEIKKINTKIIISKKGIRDENNIYGKEDASRKIR